jgi:WD40 repeat protein
VSGGFDDGKVVTWKLTNGERLGEVAAGSGALALATLDGGRFVAGTKDGEVAFYMHHGGRGVKEASRITGAHSDGISDFAACGGRLATASCDRTAALRGVDSRERVATLRGHTDWVISVDMNDRLVAPLPGTRRCESTTPSAATRAQPFWIGSTRIGSVPFR